MLYNCLRCRQESLPNQCALGLAGTAPNIRPSLSRYVQAYLAVLTWSLEKSSLFVEPSANSGVLSQRYGEPAPAWARDLGLIDDRTQTRGTTRANGNRGNPQPEKQRQTGQTQPRGASASRSAASLDVRRCGEPGRT